MSFNPASLHPMPEMIVKFDYWPILLPDSPIINKSGVHAPWTPRIIMRIEMSNGAAGWSEVPCNRGMLIVLRDIAPVIERTAATVEEIQSMLDRVFQTSKEVAHKAKISDSRGTASFDKGVSNHVRAGIQMASYDALAVHQGVPLADLLGGGSRRRNEVAFNAYLFWVADFAKSGLQYETTPKSRWNNPFAKLRDKPVLDIPAAVTLAKSAVENVMPGVTLMKWKCGVFDPDSEAALFFALDDAFGHTMRFVPDPNGAWGVETAARIARQLKEGLGDRLPYIEDFVMGKTNMARLHAKTGIPQATNMCASNEEEHEFAVALNAIQITLGGDPHYMGGSDKAVALSRLCKEKWKIKFAQHSNSHTEISLWHTAHMGAAAHLHDYPFDTHYFPWQSGRGVLSEPVVPEHGGILKITDRPGLGITVSDERVRELSEAFEAANSGARSYTDRDDGPPSDLIYGSWIRPGAGRDKQWFMAGVPESV